MARGAKPLEVEGIAKLVAARLMSLAGPGQTLLTRSGFDVARRSAVGALEGAELAWLAHGGYLFKGMEDPVEVFEVGRRGEAPLEPPADSEKVKRVVEQATITGWRPAPGLAIPHRGNWLVERRLGEGGLGEASSISSAFTRPGENRRKRPGTALRGSLPPGRSAIEY